MPKEKVKRELTKEEKQIIERGVSAEWFLAQSMFGITMNNIGDYYLKLLAGEDTNEVSKVLDHKRRLDVVLEIPKTLQGWVALKLQIEMQLEEEEADDE